jgi:hypothetical protein
MIEERALGGLAPADTSFQVPRSIRSSWGRCGIASANPPDGAPCACRTGACANGLGERSTWVGEV